MARKTNAATSGLAKTGSQNIFKKTYNKIKDTVFADAATKHQNKVNKIQRDTMKQQAKVDKLKALQEVKKLEAQNKNIKYEPEYNRKKLDADLKTKYMKHNKDVLIAKYKNQWKQTLAASFGTAANIKELKGDEQEGFINEALSQTMGKI